LGNECQISSELVDLAKEATIAGGSAAFVYDKENLKSLKVALDEVVKQISKNVLTETKTKTDVKLEDDNKIAGKKDDGDTRLSSPSNIISNNETCHIPC